MELIIAFLVGIAVGWSIEAYRRLMSHKHRWENWSPWVVHTRGIDVCLRRTRHCQDCNQKQEQKAAEHTCRDANHHKRCTHVTEFMQSDIARMEKELGL